MPSRWGLLPSLCCLCSCSYSPICSQPSLLPGPLLSSVQLAVPWDTQVLFHGAVSLRLFLLRCRIWSFSPYFVPWMYIQSFPSTVLLLTQEFSILFISGKYKYSNYVTYNYNSRLLTVRLLRISSVLLALLSSLHANIPFDNVHFADQFTFCRRKIKFSNLPDCFETSISNDTVVKTHHFIFWDSAFFFF